MAAAKPTNTRKRQTCHSADTSPSRAAERAAGSAAPGQPPLHPGFVAHLRQRLDELGNEHVAAALDRLVGEPATPATVSTTPTTRTRSTSLPEAA